MATKNILSLFDYSGNWCSFYKQAGYQVYQVDKKLDIDVLDLNVRNLPFDECYGILAAPPCTDFASSGAQYWKQKDIDGRTTHSLELVEKTLELISYYNPHFYAVENPVGRLQKLLPQLGKVWYFNPHEFAGYCDNPETEAYTKKTGLWGQFTKPEKRAVAVIAGASPIMRLGGKSERTKELRSMTPLGFSKAFFLANQ